MFVGVEERDPATGSDADSRERESVVEVQFPGAEIAILEAKIDIVADRHVDAGDQLPCHCMVLVAEFLDSCVADAATEIATDAAVAAQVEQGVDHPRQDSCAAVDVEVIVDE